MVSFIPKISYLSKSVIRILGCNPGPMTLQGTNTYIVGTGKRRVLIDTGEKDNAEYLSNLTGVLKENDLKLDSIIISHWHHDHIGGLKDVLKLNSDSAVTVFKFPRKDEPDDSFNIEPNKLQWLKGGEEIKVEGASLKVLYTPGHSTDHAVLVMKEDNVLFSGDCVLGEGTAVFEDLFDYMASLENILSCNPSVIYPGHGPVIENPVERIEYYINHRNERENQIFNTLVQNKGKSYTPMDLVKIIYKETPAQLYPAAAFNVGHHLKKLKKEGKIVCEDGEKSLWKYNSSTSSNL